jgi:hypothetical protein
MVLRVLHMFFCNGWQSGTCNAQVGGHVLGGNGLYLTYGRWASPGSSGKSRKRASPWPASFNSLRREPTAWPHLIDPQGSVVKDIRGDASFWRNLRRLLTRGRPVYEMYEMFFVARILE